MTTGQKQIAESTDAELADRLAVIRERASHSYRGWIRQDDLAEKQAIQAEQLERQRNQDFVDTCMDQYYEELNEPF